MKQLGNRLSLLANLLNLNIHCTEELMLLVPYQNVLDPIERQPVSLTIFQLID